PERACFCCRDATGGWRSFRARSARRAPAGKIPAKSGRARGSARVTETQQRAEERCPPIVDRTVFVAPLASQSAGPQHRARHRQLPVTLFFCGGAPVVQSRGEGCAPHRFGGSEKADGMPVGLSLFRRREAWPMGNTGQESAQ